MSEREHVQRTGSSVMGIVGRVIAAAVVLAITAFFTPNFTIANVWSLLLAAIVLSVLDYAASRLFKLDATPFGRGILGFVLAAVIIYATQYFVAGYSVTMFGAIIGAVVFGIVDALIPGRAM